MEELDRLRSENESLKGREEQLKLQLRISVKKVKKLEEYVVHVENSAKNRITLIP